MKMGTGLKLPVRKLFLNKKSITNILPISPLAVSNMTGFIEDNIDPKVLGSLIG